MQDVPESWQWMTPEIRELLRAIPPPHEAKRRRTVILLAFAHAMQTPLAKVFERPDTCAEQIWWTKWQYVPEIAAALDACKKRALEWADDLTVATEEHFRRERRRSVAEYAAKAPAALAAVMAGPDQKGADRINAAVTLINLAENKTVGTTPGGTDVKVGDEQGGLQIRVVYDDANHSPAQALPGTV